MIKRNKKQRNIFIYTDSKISIKCIEKLNELKLNNKLVQICWILKEIHRKNESMGNKESHYQIKKIKERIHIQLIYKKLQK